MVVGKIFLGLNIQISESTRFQDHQSRPGLGILSVLGTGEKLLVSRCTAYNSTSYIFTVNFVVHERYQIHLDVLACEYFMFSFGSLINIYRIVCFVSYPVIIFSQMLPVTIHSFFCLVPWYFLGAYETLNNCWWPAVTV